MALGAVGYFGMFDCHRDNELCEIARKRQAAIATAPQELDTIFIGDSSLGFSVDQVQFSQLKGGKSLNLHLFGGAFGAPGAYSILVQALQRSQVKNVVIMMTPENFTRSIASLDYLPIRGLILASHGHPTIPLSVNWRVSRDALRQMARLAFDKTSIWRGIAAFAAERPAQLTRFPQQADPEKVDVRWTVEPTADYQPFLERMAQICAVQGVNCIYIHGTLFDKVCASSAEYIEKVSNLVRQSGLRLAYQSAICFPKEDYFNTVNHTHPDLIGVYTEIVYDLLKPFLR